MHISPPYQTDTRAGQHLKANSESYLGAIKYCFLNPGEWRTPGISQGQTKVRGTSLASHLILPRQLRSWLSFLLLPRGGKHKVWWRSAVTPHLSTESKAQLQRYHPPLLWGGAVGSSDGKRVGSQGLPPKRDPVPGAQPPCFSHKPKGIILGTWGSTSL